MSHYRQANSRSFMGYRMDSEIEYQRALYLHSLEQDGVISMLELDKTELRTILLTGIKIPAHPLRPRGFTMGVVAYTPDFRYRYKGDVIVEDVKAAYGDTPKNRNAGRAGKPIISEASKLRMRIYQMKNPAHIFRIVTTPTLDPDEIERYFWLMRG